MNSNAFDVNVIDKWSPESFELRSGSHNMTWETVAPGESVSGNITMAPKSQGHIEGFRAYVEYKATADGPIQVEHFSYFVFV